MEGIKIELDPREVMICVEALQEYAKKHKPDRAQAKHVIKKILDEVVEGYMNEEE